MRFIVLLFTLALSLTSGCSHNNLLQFELLLPTGTDIGSVPVVRDITIFRPEEPPRSIAEWWICHSEMEGEVATEISICFKMPETPASVHGSFSIMSKDGVILEATTTVNFTDRKYNRFQIPLQPRRAEPMYMPLWFSPEPSSTVPDP